MTGSGELLQTKDPAGCHRCNSSSASDQTSAVTNAVVVTNGAGIGITLESDLGIKCSYGD